jgi:hypothetical protein
MGAKHAVAATAGVSILGAGAFYKYGRTNKRRSYPTRCLMEMDNARQLIEEWGGDVNKRVSNRLLLPAGECYLLTSKVSSCKSDQIWTSRAFPGKIIIAFSDCQLFATEILTYLKLYDTNITLKISGSFICDGQSQKYAALTFKAFDYSLCDFVIAHPNERKKILKIMLRLMDIFEILTKKNVSGYDWRLSNIVFQNKKWKIINFEDSNENPTETFNIFKLDVFFPLVLIACGDNVQDFVALSQYSFRTDITQEQQSNHDTELRMMFWKKLEMTPRPIASISSLRMTLDESKIFL